MDTHRVPAPLGGRFAARRVVGALLITEGVLVAIPAVHLSLVYVVASGRTNADRFRTPLSALPAVGAHRGRGRRSRWRGPGSFLRRGPTGRVGPGGTGGRASRSSRPACSTSPPWPPPSAGPRCGRRPPSTSALAWIAIAVTVRRRDRRARARRGPQPRRVDTRDGGMTPAASIRACPNASIGIPARADRRSATPSAPGQAALERLGERTWAEALDWLYDRAMQRPTAPVTSIRRCAPRTTARPGGAPAARSSGATSGGRARRVPRATGAVTAYAAQHPGSYSYFTPPPLPIAIAAGAAPPRGSNQGIDLWLAGMAAPFVEEEVTRWLCDLTGLRRRLVGGILAPRVASWRTSWG